MKKISFLLSIVLLSIASFAFITGGAIPCDMSNCQKFTSHYDRFFRGNKRECTLEEYREEANKKSTWQLKKMIEQLDNIPANDQDLAQRVTVCLEILEQTGLLYDHWFSIKAAMRLGLYSHLKKNLTASDSYNGDKVKIGDKEYRPNTFFDLAATDANIELLTVLHEKGLTLNGYYIESVYKALALKKNECNGDFSCEEKCRLFSNAFGQIMIKQQSEQE